MTFVDKGSNGKKAIDKATLQWLIEASSLVEGQAVMLVPVSTAFMKNDIGYKVDESEMVSYIGTNAEYAVYVEFGTGEFAENGQGRKGGWFYKDPSGEWIFTWGQSPQPFMRTAFKQTKKQVESLAKEIFGGI